MMKSAIPLNSRLFPALGLPMLLALAAGVRSEPAAEAAGWPALNGPTGNLLPAPSDARWVDDPRDARLLWVSEDADFGTAKTGSQTFRTAKDVLARLGPDAAVPPGNWANPVVAGGKVFGTSFRPCGPFHSGRMSEKDGGGEVTFRLDAEDVVFALDAETGKTLWRTAEPGGIVLSGGKRGGFQVAPCVSGGTVFWIGSTGRLFAHDAATGARRWQTDIGPAAQGAAKQRDKALEAAGNGLFTRPNGPEWFTSPVVADGVLVAPTFSGSNYGRDTGLRGYDPADGRLLWEAKDAISRWTTPALWTHGSRTYLLCATISGRLHLLDPRDGRELWCVDGLGPHYFPLAPSARTVLVNAKPSAGKRTPGLYAAYRLSPEGATLAWTLPDEPRNQIPTWFDTCCRQRYAIANGRVYTYTEGTKEAPGRFVILDEETGKVLAEHSNASSQDADCLGGLFYLVGDRILCRADSAHGASRGGRHPLFLWSVAGDRIERLPVGGDTPGGVDLLDFTTAYEVYEELPIVDGRVFERTVDGRLACYDLRAEEGMLTLLLQLKGANIGLPAPLPLRLRFGSDGRFAGGSSRPPSSEEAGLVYSKGRRSTQWEAIGGGERVADADPSAWRMTLGFQTHTWPFTLSLRRDGDNVTGTWTRTVEALAEPLRASGNVSGTPPHDNRVYPTGWLKDMPWTPVGRNPPGTRTIVLQIAGILPFKTPAAGMTLCLDHDGTAFVRGAAGAFSYDQAWHEVDPSGLRFDGETLTGNAVVVLNADAWTFPNPVLRSGAAGTLAFDVKLGPEGFTGRCEAVWGEALVRSGDLDGRVEGDGGR